MKDTIIKNSGNSRTLASTPNFLTLYPTYEAFGQALINRELPIDLGPLNPAGCEVVGSDLSKETLMSDGTEQSIWGNAGNRTVDAALSKLRALITAAHSLAYSANANANSRVRIETGSFSTPAETVNLSFSFPPKAFACAGKYDTFGVWLYGTTAMRLLNTVYLVGCAAEQSGNSLRLESRLFSNTSNPPETYKYVAIG